MNAGVVRRLTAGSVVLAAGIFANRVEAQEPTPAGVDFQADSVVAAIARHLVASDGEETPIRGALASLGQRTALSMIAHDELQRTTGEQIVRAAARILHDEGISVLPARYVGIRAPTDVPGRITLVQRIEVWLTDGRLANSCLRRDTRRFEMECIPHDDLAADLRIGELRPQGPGRVGSNITWYEWPEGRQVQRKWGVVIERRPDGWTVVHAGSVMLQ